MYVCALQYVCMACVLRYYRHTHKRSKGAAEFVSQAVSQSRSDEISIVRSSSTPAVDIACSTKKGLGRGSGFFFCHTFLVWRGHAADLAGPEQVCCCCSCATRAATWKLPRDWALEMSLITDYGKWRMTSRVLICFPFLPIDLGAPMPAPIYS